MDGAKIEETAFVEAMEKVRVRLFRFLRRVTRDYHLAQDLTQETFLRALEAHRGGTPPARIQGWLFCVAYRAAIDRRRRRRPPEPMGRLDDRPAPEPRTGFPERIRVGGALVSREEVLAEMQEALEDLPLRYRDALRAHYEEGLTCREVGGVLGIRRENAKMRLLRGRRWIARRLRQRLASAPEEGRDGWTFSAWGRNDEGRVGRDQEESCETVG